MLTDLPWLPIFAMTMLGLLTGSFLNVVIHRLPIMMQRQWARDCADLNGNTGSAPAAAAATAPFNLLLPRSRCPHCGHAIAWYENIPVLSYLALRGKCSACKTAISPRYPAVEVVTALLFASAAWQHGASWNGLVWAVFCALLVALFLIDMDTQLLPDDLNYLLLWLGLVGAALGWNIPLKSAVWGAVLGYLCLWSVFQLHHLLTGKVGMGHGDFKLLAALGAWFGAEQLIAIILLSSLVGSVLGGLMLLAGRLSHKDIPIAFGPFLAGAGLLFFVLGPRQLAQWLPFAFPFASPIA
ncbi:MAG: prepilin peptidase [Rhodoferax sp.]|nr:prepilin peptidase [Rhodoferax sp.]